MTAPHASCSVFLIKKIIVGGVKVDNIVTVGGHINASINFAMQQNYVPVIRSLVVNNNSEEALENISLKITFEPEFAKEFTYHIGCIDLVKCVFFHYVYPPNVNISILCYYTTFMLFFQVQFF